MQKIWVKKNIGFTFNSDFLTKTELNELWKISSSKEEYSSLEVDQILYLRDLFKENWIIVEDLDVFENILNWIKQWKNFL